MFSFFSIICVYIMPLVRDFSLSILTLGSAPPAIEKSSDEKLNNEMKAGCNFSFVTTIGSSSRSVPWPLEDSCKLDSKACQFFSAVQLLESVLNY